METDRRYWLKAILQYTLAYCIFVLCIFGVLIIDHSSFMQFHDAFMQGAFRLIEIRNQFREILSGNGFSYWSWYEGTGLDEPLDIFVDPCSYVAAGFPIRYLELGFTFAALLRLYLGGIAFVLLGREVEMTRTQAVLGAVLYIFSAAFIGLALRQSGNLFNAYLFPLLVIGVERIYKGKSPLPFILTIVYYMLISIYYSYMAALMIIVYILIRYFRYNDGFDMRKYIGTVARFIGYGLIGIMISAFGSLFSYYTLTRASIDSSMESQGLLFDSDFYMELGEMLLGTGATYDYYDIGLPILVLMFIPVAIRRCTKRSTNTIMTMILFIMLLIPFFGSMFNGFGYVTFRWSFMLVLFAVWSAVEQLDPEVLKNRKYLRIAGVGLLVMAIWTFVLERLGVNHITDTAKIFIPLQLLAGAAILILFYRYKYRDGIGRSLTAMLFLIPLVSISAGWSVGFMNNIDEFAKNSSVYNNLNESTLRVGDKLGGDDFYRVDSVDGIFRHAELKFPPNENIWWESNNLFIYNSLIPQSLTDFNVEMGNTYGYARRVYMLSNGNRPGLDYLHGVRYYLGNDTRKEGYETSDDYAGYGFEKYKTVDGVEVYKNRYDVGMGFVLEKAMLKSDFDTLDRLEKEQALLQVAVIPDEQAKECRELTFVKPRELDLDIEEVAFKVVDRKDVTMEEGFIRAHSDNASFTIAVDKVPKSQYVVSFDGLLRNSDDGSDSRSYEIYAGTDKVRKEIIYTISRQGVRGIKDHSLWIGAMPGTDRIKIEFERSGRYTFDRFYVSAMSEENYDRYAAEGMERKLTVDDYSNRQVKGRVDAGNGGVLFLSITAFENWDVYVDGKKTEKIENLDTAFVGTQVPAGTHEVTLKYKNRYVEYGCIVSLVGILIAVAVLVLRRRQLRMTGSDR